MNAKCSCGNSMPGGYGVCDDCLLQIVNPQALLKGLGREVTIKALRGMEEVLRTRVTPDMKPWKNRPGEEGMI